MEAWRRKWSILGEEEELHGGGDFARLISSSEWAENGVECGRSHSR